MLLRAFRLQQGRYGDSATLLRQVESEVTRDEISECVDA